ncbi:hypothetical protein [Raoultella lignicola]|uniref:Tail fiber protein n=1 Tax=Raoultella lignicola TaxID=3040939 RepID=A0ABU9FB86_9ENTR
MSVPSQTPYNIYTANGLTTVFAYQFMIMTAGDLEVSINGTTVASGFTVQGAGQTNGGQVVFITPPANGDVVMLLRKVAIKRDTDYQDNGDLLAETINADFDRLWLAMQQAFLSDSLSLKRPLLGGPYNAGNLKIINLQNPTNPQDATTKAWVDLQYSVPTSEAKQAAAEAKAARNETVAIATKFGDVDNAITVATEARDTALDAAARGEIYAERAENAAENAQNIADANTYYTTPEDPDGTIAGLAGTAEGGSFRVGTGPGKPFIYYLKLNGLAVEIAGDDRLATDDSPGGVIVSNDDGQYTFIQSAAGNTVINGNEVFDSTNMVELTNDDGQVITVVNYRGNVVIGGCEVSQNNNVFSIENDDGLRMTLFDEEGNSTSGGSEPVGADWYLKYAQNNIANANRISNTTLTNIPPLSSKYIQFLFLGQSYMSAQEGWSAKTKTQPLDNLMLGDSTRPIRMGGFGTWESMGGADVLKPLIATVQTYSDTSVLLTPEQVAALAPGNSALGEDIPVGFLNLLRKSYLSRKQLRSDANHQFIATNCGISGRNLNCLMNSADWNRVPRSAEIIKGIADSEGATSQLGAIVIGHGEYDSIGTNNSTYLARPTRADYLEGLNLYITKVRESVGRDVYSMSDYASIPVFLYQVGGTYTNDSTNMGVAMAQMDAAMTMENVFLVGSYSFMPDKTAHLSPNSYRWLSMFFAKTAIRTLLEQRASNSCYITSAIANGKEIVININSPSYPIISQPAYLVNSPVLYSDLGFTVIVNGVRESILSAEIVSQSQVRLTMANDVTGSATIRYADKTYHGGLGNIFDSDSTESMYTYEYIEGSGDYPASNIPALTGKKYPLNNPLLAASVSVEIL